MVHRCQRPTAVWDPLRQAAPRRTRDHTLTGGLGLLHVFFVGFVDFVAKKKGFICVLRPKIVSAWLRSGIEGMRYG